MEMGHDMGARLASEHPASRRSEVLLSRAEQAAVGQGGEVHIWPAGSG